MVEFLLLFMAAFVAAAISGAAGFGGALLLLPLLVATVGVDQAVPLLTVAQFVGNLSRVGFGFHQICWRPVWQFLLAAIPCSVLGALSFVQCPQDLLARLIGLVILVFVVLKYFGLLQVGKVPLLLWIGGAVTGFLSGIAGSAGPLGAAVFLSLGLPPVAYIASEAVTALVIHGAKSLVYQHYIHTGMQFWSMAVSMSSAMVLGTWSARRIIEQMPRERFQRYVACLLVAISVYMIVCG